MHTVQFSKYFSEQIECDTFTDILILGSWVAFLHEILYNMARRLESANMEFSRSAIPSDLPIFNCTKELSLWNKIKYLNLNIFRTRCCKPLIFQTQIIWSNKIHSLKYLRSATFGSKDIVIRKFEFVAKTQFLRRLIWKAFFKMLVIDFFTIMSNIVCF